MRVIWEEFKVYPDGSQSDTVYGKLCLGDKEYHVTIEDHTREGQKLDDAKIHRDVTHAYIVGGLPHYIGSECFRKMGFDFATIGVNSCGIDKNEGYESRESMYSYIGTPKHTIKEVEELVVKAFIEAFTFDYDTKLAEFKAELDARKERMNEALAFDLSNFEYGEVGV